MSSPAAPGTAALLHNTYPYKSSNIAISVHIIPTPGGSGGLWGRKFIEEKGHSFLM